MSVTHCLGDFAQRIRKQPMAKWGAEIARLPDVCPNGCKTNCRDVCRQYARDQREIAKRRTP